MKDKITNLVADWLVGERVSGWNVKNAAVRGWLLSLSAGILVVVHALIKLEAKDYTGFVDAFSSPEAKEAFAGVMGGLVGMFHFRAQLGQRLALDKQAKGELKKEAKEATVEAEAEK